MHAKMSEGKSQVDRSWRRSEIKLNLIFEEIRFEVVN
jgi:hypothetical protein